MVQALINNSNLTQSFTSNIDVSHSNVNFQKLFDAQKSIKKSGEQGINGTLGKMKESQGDKFDELKNEVKNAVHEAAEESSLDLSSEKDIEEDFTLISASVQSYIQNDQCTANNAEEINNIENICNSNIDEVLTNFEIADPDIGDPQDLKKEITLKDIADEDTLSDLNIESFESEEAEIDSEVGSDIMKNQTPQEQGIKAILHQPNSISVENDFSIETFVSKNAETVRTNTTKILEQIAKQINELKGGSRVNMVLNPESLGKISIQLVNTKEGLSAQFTVATQEAREVLMKGLESLKDNLASHGVSVDNVSVKLNDTQESEHNSDWTEQEGSRGGNKNQNPEKRQKSKEEFEQAMLFAETENG